MAELIAKTYGIALFELAKENNRNRLEAIEKEVDVVLEVLRENNELFTVLNHPKIVKEQKTDLLEKIFKDKISNHLMGLMVLVVKKERYNFLVEILEYFNKFLREEKGIIKATITSAHVLKEEQKEKVKKRLIEITNKTVEMEYQMDPSLIGGLTIRIGDRVVDNSVKGKIGTLEKQLMKVGLA